MNNINLMQMASLMKSGGNPMAMLQRMAASNPQAAQAMQIINGKSPEQLRQIAINMARERGTTPEQIAKSLGLM